MFWVISVYLNIRNTLPKSGTFLLGHPVYMCVCVFGVYYTNNIYIVGIAIDYGLDDPGSNPGGDEVFRPS